MNEKFVKVTPIKQGGQVTWELSYGGKKGLDPGSYPPIILPANSGKHKITFTIDNAQGITFSDDPIWVDVATTPPASPKQAGIHAQIDKVKLHNSTQLVIEDKNKGDPVTLSYQLNFVGAPPLDPIIQNGGGTGPGVYGWEMLAVAFVAGVAATFAVQLLRKLFNSRR